MNAATEFDAQITAADIDNSDAILSSRRNAGAILLGRAGI